MKIAPAIAFAAMLFAGQPEDTPVRSATEVAPIHWSLVVTDSRGEEWVIDEFFGASARADCLDGMWANGGPKRGMSCERTRVEPLAVAPEVRGR